MPVRPAGHAFQVVRPTSHQRVNPLGVPGTFRVGLSSRINRMFHKLVGGAVLVLHVAQAVGQAVVTRFDPELPYRTLSDPVLMAAAGGKVLMRLNGWTGDERLEQWSAVFVLDSRGAMLRRIELPSDGLSTVVPYRSGFVSLQNGDSAPCLPHGSDCIPKRWEFVYHDLTRPDLRPVVLGSRREPAHLVGSPDRKDLYVVGSAFPYGMQDVGISRLDESFHTVWTLPIGGLEVGSLVATDDGIAFTQYKETSPLRYVLRAIGRDGDNRWEAEVPHRAPSDLRFLPTGHLIVPAGGRTSPLWVASKTGAILPDISLPNRDIEVPTQDGLLLVGWMLGQSYAGMMTDDGDFAWMRRFTRDANLQTFKGGVAASDGRLLLVANGASSSSYTLLSVDREGKGLEKMQSSCLTVQPKEAIALSERLQGRSIHVVAPNEPPVDPQSGPPMTRSDGCPIVTESEYMAFMDSFLAELPPAAQHRPQFPQLAIRLLESGKSTRLRSYNLYYGGGWSPRGAYAEFLVPHDQGHEFGRFYTTVWQPHVKRMMVMQDEFARLTRFVYGTRVPDRADYRQTLADLEAAAAQLNEVIRAMPAEKLRFIREKPAVGVVSVLLTPQGFGNGYTGDRFEERPIEQAAETLIHIVKEHRKAVARGEITLE